MLRSPVQHEGEGREEEREERERRNQDRSRKSRTTNMTGHFKYQKKNQDFVAACSDRDRYREERVNLKKSFLLEKSLIELSSLLKYGYIY